MEEEGREKRKNIKLVLVKISYFMVGWNIE